MLLALMAENIKSGGDWKWNAVCTCAYHTEFGIQYWKSYKEILGKFRYEVMPIVASYKNWVLCTNIVRNSTVRRVRCSTGRHYRPVVTIFRV